MKKQEKRQRKPISTKEFLTIGRKHFAEDFPNPKRLGCPPGNELKLQAEKPLMAKEPVLNHISFCSPCYRAFSRFLREQTAKPKQRISPAEDDKNGAGGNARDGCDRSLPNS